MATGSSKPKPVSAHPLFPAIVGLWFAALFGLGSLAIRPALLEQAVLALQLDTLVPAAAPPFGATARILLALVMATIGAAIGVRLGRGFAERAAAPKPQPRQRAVAPESQVSVQPAVPGFLAGRRRALTIDDSDEAYQHHDAAPLPGGGVPQVFDITTLSPAPAPLDLSTFAEPEFEPELVVEPEPVAERQVFQPAPANEPVAATEPPRFEAVQAPPPVSVAAHSAPRADLGGDPEALGTVQLAERLALAMERRRARRAAIGAADAAERTAEPVAVEVRVAEAPPASFARLGVSAEPASALEIAELPVPPPLPAALRPFAFAEIGDDDDGGLEDAGPLASLLPPRRSEFAAIEPEEAASEIGPADDEGVEEDAAAQDDTSYSSLLDLGALSAPRQDFVRIEEPAPLADAIEPVVIFPGQLARTAAPDGPRLASIAPQPVAPEGFRPFDSPSSAGSGQPVAASTQAVQQDPVETERALRAALSNLQRMSGAA